MRDIDHIRQPGYVMALRQIMRNAKYPWPEPLPWYRVWLWTVRSWALGR